MIAHVAGLPVEELVLAAAIATYGWLTARRARSATGASSALAADHGVAPADDGTVPADDGTVPAAAAVGPT